MIFCARRFNLYLLLTTVLLVAAGCVTDKKDKKIALLRVHIESANYVNAAGKTVTLLRDKPVNIVIEPDPILTEANIIAATLLETPGGFAVEVKFDSSGSWMLEQYSAANPGKHLVIFGQWGDKLMNTRWLAAPIITHRVANGILSFTPDADRDEVKLLVQGLNNNAKKNLKNSFK